MTDDDLLIIGSLDQPIQTNDDWLMNQIDEIMKQSIAQQNVYIALNAGKTMYAIGKAVGKGLAKLLYEVQKNWENYGISEDYGEVVFDYIGLHESNITRYIRVMEMLEEEQIPEQYREDISQMNMRQLIPIATTLSQGYEIEDDEWEKLVDAPDLSTVSKILREDIKEKPMRKGALALYLDNEGSLWAYWNDDRYSIGTLNVHDKNEAVKKAIERITRCAGVLRQ